AVSLVAVVRNVEPDFVQCRRPLEQSGCELRFELPRCCALLEKKARRVRDTSRLCRIDRKAPPQRAYAAGARILVPQPSQVVVKKTLAKRAVGRAQAS